MSKKTGRTLSVMLAAAVVIGLASAACTQSATPTASAAVTTPAGATSPAIGGAVATVLAGAASPTRVPGGPVAQATSAASHPAGGATVTPTAIPGLYGGGPAPTPGPNGRGISGQAQNAPANYHGPFGFGRDVTNDEIAAWNIDVLPDGTGLPQGSGTVSQGATVFSSKCAACHGADGQGVTGAGAAASGPPLVKPFDPNAKFPQFPLAIRYYCL